MLIEILEDDRNVLEVQHAAARALERTFGELRRQGTTAHLGDALISFDEFNSLVGVEERYAFDERYGAASSGSGGG